MPRLICCFGRKTYTKKEKDPDPTVVVIWDKQRLPWRQVQADMSGKGFDLRSVLGREPASAYLLTYVFSPKEQKVKLQHQSDEKLQLWLGGKNVAPQTDMTPITLQQGWNVLLLRMNNAEASPFLSARIVGGDGVRISLQKD